MNIHTKERLLPQVKILASLYALTVLIILGIKMICAAKGLNLDAMLHDPLTVAQAPFYTGCLSNLGILGWAYAASVFFFGWQQALEHSASKGHTNFLFCSWIISTVLTLDDLFILHEDVFPSVLGIQEEAVYALYFALIAAYLLAFQKILRNKLAAILIPALLFFGLSIVLDEIVTQLPLVLEEGAKLLGILTWAFYAHTAARYYSGAQIQGTAKA